MFRLISCISIFPKYADKQKSKMFNIIKCACANINTEFEVVNSIYNSASVYAPLDEFPELLDGA